MKPQLQARHGLTTWLQVWYHSLLWGDIIQKRADFEKQNCSFGVYFAELRKLTFFFLPTFFLRLPDRMCNLSFLVHFFGILNIVLRKKNSCSAEVNDGEEYIHQVFIVLEDFAKTGTTLRFYDTFEAVTYRTQIVFGTNYLIKVKTDDGYMLVRVYEPLPDSNELPSLLEYKKVKSLEKRFQIAWNIVGSGNAMADA